MQIKGYIANLEIKHTKNKENAHSARTGDSCHCECACVPKGDSRIVKSKNTEVAYAGHFKDKANYSHFKT